MSQTLNRTARGETHAAGINLEVTECTCGVLFAMPARLLRQRREDGEAFYCPHGHSLVFNSGKTALEVERSRLQRARDEQARLQARLDQAEASRVAQKAAAKRARNERDRLKTRAANGVCPCCNRTFKQLARHMAAKHPGFDKAGQDGHA